jgi:hypothetical protein
MPGYITNRWILMKASVTEGRMIMLMGVIVVCLLGTYVAYKTIVSPTVESSKEAQAKVMANMIAISVNSLSGLDAGRVQKDFGFAEPLDVEIYEKNPGKGNMYVKVTYTTKGTDEKSYEVPLLVSVNPVPKTKLNAVYVIKDEGGSIRLEGNIREYMFTEKGDVGCIPPPSDNELQGSITSAFLSASSKYPAIEDVSGWNEALIKAVIMKESSFQHCDGAYYMRSGADAIGLMQLRTPAASEVKSNRKDWNDNVRGGAEYLAKQINAFKSVELGLAAYNCGPGCIAAAKELCEGGGTPCAWNEVKKYLNPYNTETPAYVPKVMEYYRNCYASGAAACSTACKKLC